nr:hypothetical protein TetV2_00224 [Oceanusvirus sp.]
MEVFHAVPADVLPENHLAYKFNEYFCDDLKRDTLRNIVRTNPDNAVDALLDFFERVVEVASRCGLYGSQNHTVSEVVVDILPFDRFAELWEKIETRSSAADTKAGFSIKMLFDTTSLLKNWIKKGVDPTRVTEALRPPTNCFKEILREDPDQSDAFFEALKKTKPSTRDSVIEMIKWCLELKETGRMNAGDVDRVYRDCLDSLRTCPHNRKHCESELKAHEWLQAVGKNRFEKIVVGI